MPEPKPVANGTIRIKSSDLKAYRHENGQWKKTNAEFADALHVIGLFKAHRRLDALKDAKNPAFLKGALSPEQKPVGARITVLPDNTKLNGAYSLFAKHLTIHDETTHDHWDAIYQNPNGNFAYLYSLSKKKRATQKKYQKVREFEKKYPLIFKNALQALAKPNDCMALPMVALLFTLMRVGNELYYKAHRHKGLTTLKKSDIKIRGTTVTFRFLSKDGVPQTIRQTFPALFVHRLKQQLQKIKKSDFVFTDPSTKKPLKDTAFKKAFARYCGTAFYPHLVRSFFATQQAEEFLKSHRQATKQEVSNLFLSIAQRLGHKKYSKKTHEWQDAYNVTVRSYIRPALVDQIKARIKPVTHNPKK